MRIASIDSSGLVATVAILDEDQMIAEYTINYKKTHSQTLLPMLDEIVDMTQIDLSSLSYIAIAKGPGSFTGLRIGSATAKGLALALNIPIIEVPTVDGLAMNLWGTSDLVCPLMDARRDQVYTGLYEFDAAGRLKVVCKQCAVAVTQIIEKVNEIGRSVIFLGDGVPVYQSVIEQNIAVPFKFAPSHMARQRAGALGALAIQYLREHDTPNESDEELASNNSDGIRVVSAAEHSPDYLRKSQAEREREEKIGL